MHMRSQDFGLDGPNNKSHAMSSSKIFERREIFGIKNERSEARGLVWHVTRILLKERDQNGKLKSFTNTYIKIGGRRGERISVTQTYRRRGPRGEAPSRRRLWGPEGRSPQSLGDFLFVWKK